MKSAYENITPKLAEKYLNVNTNNRPLREGHAEKMVADMKAGTWTFCTAPIVFYTDGSLADGQHRLWAIIESGKTHQFYVIRDLPKDAGRHIDTGVTRTAVDVARIHGIDPELSNAIASIARGIEDGTPSNRWGTGRTIDQMLDVVAKHREAAHWVSKNGPKYRGTRNTAVLSAIGRAWYVEIEKERLQHFCKVLNTGFAITEEDSAAIALRNYLISLITAKKGPSSNVLWRDTFLKSQNAVFYFMHHKPLTFIKGLADEQYPLANAAKPVVPTTKRGERHVARAKKATKKKTKTNGR